MDDKPYRITFDERPGYLHVFVEGSRDSYAISAAYWREIAEVCERNGTTKLFVEEDIPEAVGFSDMYRIAAELPEMFRGIIIAFVDRYADQTELNTFGELVAQNRGVRGRLFADAEAAEKWLLAQ